VLNDGGGIQRTGASCARWLEEGTTRPLVCRADRPLRLERVNALENRIILLACVVASLMMYNMCRVSRVTKVK
jgi:hypothetical protein